MLCTDRQFNIRGKKVVHVGDTYQEHLYKGIKIHALRRTQPMVQIYFTTHVHLLRRDDYMVYNSYIQCWNTNYYFSLDNLCCQTCKGPAIRLNKLRSN